MEPVMETELLEEVVGFSEAHGFEYSQRRQVPAVGQGPAVQHGAQEQIVEITVTEISRQVNHLEWKIGDYTGRGKLLGVEAQAVQKGFQGAARRTGNRRVVDCAGMFLVEVGFRSQITQNFPCFSVRHYHCRVAGAVVPQVLDGLGCDRAEVVLHLGMEGSSHRAGIGCLLIVSKLVDDPENKVVAVGGAGFPFRHGEEAELGHASLVGFPVDDTFIFEDIQYHAGTGKSIQKTLKLEDVVSLRRSRQTGEQGRFRPAQVLQRLAKIAAGGVGESVHLASLGHDFHVLPENGIMTESAYQTQSRAHLDGLVPQRPFRRELHSDHLHGDGGGSLTSCLKEVREKRPGNRPQIYTRMSIETPVLHGENACFDPLRYGSGHIPKSQTVILMGSFGEKVAETVFEKRCRMR